MRKYAQTLHQYFIEHRNMEQNNINLNAEPMEHFFLNLVKVKSWKTPVSYG
jgi:hypothetical protein